MNLLEKIENFINKLLILLIEFVSKTLQKIIPPPVKAKIENCARAKQARTTFDSGVRVARTNAAGEREVMDDAARAAEVKRIQAVIDSDCK